LTIKLTRPTAASPQRRNELRLYKSATTRRVILGPRLLLIARTLGFPSCTFAPFVVNSFSNHEGHKGTRRNSWPRTPAGLRHS